MAISDVGRTEIRRRKAASRLLALDDMGRVVSSRGGAVTPMQINFIAVVMSHVIPADDLVGTLVGWFSANGIADDTAQAYLESPTWQKLLAATQAADRGEEDTRLDPSIPTLVRTFAIDETTEEELNLGTLMSAARKKRLARRAEGIPSRAEMTKSEPWKDMDPPMSKATYYRNEARRKAAERAALAARLAEPVETSPAAGGETSRVSIAREPSPSFFIGYRDAKRLTPQRPTEASIFGTTEAKQLALLADTLGMEWAAGDRFSSDPGKWWTRPFGAAALTDKQQVQWTVAVAAARRGEARARNLAAANARKAAEADKRTDAEKSAAFYAKLAADEARMADTDTCPPQVSPTVWDIVPCDIRSRVIDVAARLFILGGTRDDAVIAAAEEIRRLDALPPVYVDAAPVPQLAAAPAPEAPAPAAPEPLAGAELIAAMDAEHAYNKERNAKRAAAAGLMIAAEIAAYIPPIPEGQRDEVHRMAVENIRNGVPQDFAVGNAVGAIQRRAAAAGES